MTLTKNTHLPPGSIPKGARKQHQVSQDPGTGTPSHSTPLNNARSSSESPCLSKPQYSNSARCEVQTSRSDARLPSEVDQPLVAPIFFAPSSTSVKTPKSGGVALATPKSAADALPMDCISTIIQTNKMKSASEPLSGNNFGSQSFKTPPVDLNFQFLSEMSDPRRPTVNESAMEAEILSRKKGSDPGADKIREIIHDYESRMQGKDHRPGENRMAAHGADDDDDDAAQEDRIIGVFYAAGNLGIAFYDEPNVPNG